jgi:hypothetical protein
MDLLILSQYDVSFLILYQYNIRMSILAIYYLYLVVGPEAKLPLDLLYQLPRVSGPDTRNHGPCTPCHGISDGLMTVISACCTKDCW